MDVMELTFLGTASAYPSPKRGVSCTALRHDSGIWLVDCGEGAQIQFMKSPLKPGKISKIFITHLHGDHCFGLPGLICTISQTQERAQPVEIFGPVGLRHFLCTALALSRAELTFEFVVHELQTISAQEPDETKDWPLEVPKEVPFHPCEKPGSFVHCDNNEVWTLFSEDKMTVKAVWVKHRVPSFSYIFLEGEKPGKLDAAKLKTMGVPPGPLYAQLKAGTPVTLDNGHTIQPCEVLGPATPGRKVIISGDSCDSSQLFKVGQGANVLVHETTLENGLQEQCIAKGHSTPEMTSNLAKDLDVKMLILTHFSPRYKPVSMPLKEDEKSAQILLDEALQVLPEERVLLAEDFVTYLIPR